MSRLSRVVALAACAAAVGSCLNPEHEAMQMEALETLGIQMNEIRLYISDLEWRIDSLRTVVARQDTALVRLSEFTGVPLPRVTPW